MRQVGFGGARGCALFLGGWFLANAVGGALHGGFDAGGWVVGGRLGGAVRILAGPLLVGWALVPTAWNGRARWVPSLAASALVVAASLDGWRALVAFRGPQVDPWSPLPLSFVVALGSLVVGLAARPRERVSRPALERWTLLGTALLLAAVFPAVQFLAYGRTDYRRPADTIVVFGARAYADGRPSDALADRVRTGVELYHQGLAPELFMSGGPGDGDVHEVEAMRELAVELGVPADAVRLDRDGWSTEATVRNTTRDLSARGRGTVLAVSHDFHLPRIRMAYQRAGWERVATVPARQARSLSSAPYLWLRETAAFWVYWLRG